MIKRACPELFAPHRLASDKAFAAFVCVMYSSTVCAMSAIVGMFNS